MFRRGHPRNRNRVAPSNAARGRAPPEPEVTRRPPEIPRAPTPIFCSDTSSNDDCTSRPRAPMLGDIDLRARRHIEEAPPNYDVTMGRRRSVSPRSPRVRRRPLVGPRMPDIVDEVSRITSRGVVFERDVAYRRNASVGRRFSVPHSPNRMMPQSEVACGRPCGVDLVNEPGPSHTLPRMRRRLPVVPGHLPDLVRGMLRQPQEREQLQQHHQLQLNEQYQRQQEIHLHQIQQVQKDYKLQQEYTIQQEAQKLQEDQELKKQQDQQEEKKQEDPQEQQQDNQEAQEEKNKKETQENQEDHQWGADEHTHNVYLQIGYPASTSRIFVEAVYETRRASLEEIGTRMPENTGNGRGSPMRPRSTIPGERPSNNAGRASSGLPVTPRPSDNQHRVSVRLSASRSTSPTRVMDVITKI